MSNKYFKPLPKAHTIIKSLHVRRLSAGSHPQLASYDARAGLYVVDDWPIRLAAQQKCERTVKNYHVQEILKAVQRNAPVIGPWQLNNPERRIIVFKNGVFDLATDAKEDHSPEWLYSIGIPHRYDPGATCPDFERFIKQVLPAEAHPLVRQLLGYLLIPSAEFRKFFVFLGNGANGKSTLIKVIEALLGRNNVTQQSLHSLGQNRFAAFDLFGKLANTYADLDDHDVTKIGLLKQIASGDAITYERKFKDTFSGPVTARLVFSANKMPHLKDESHAIADRLIMLEFPHRFEEKQQDKSLGFKLTTSSELEGILARWAVPGLQNLLVEGQFNVPHDSCQLLQDYRRDCDPFLQVVRETLEVAPKEWVSRSDLYTHYVCWCEKHGVLPMSQQQLNRRIADHFNIPNSDRRAPGSRERVWWGIRFKEAAGVAA